MKLSAAGLCSGFYPKAFFPELGALHLVFHPARRSATTGPNQLRVFLAAELRDDLCHLLATLFTSRPADLIRGAGQCRKLRFQILGFAGKYVSNFIPHFHQRLDGHRCKTGILGHGKLRLMNSPGFGGPPGERQAPLGGKPGITRQFVLETARCRSGALLRPHTVCRLNAR